MDKIIIYCDGACSNNQQKQNRGGWGAILLYRGKSKEISGAERNTTNNRMELMACIQALAAVKNRSLPVEVFTDSAYLANCLLQKWYPALAEERLADRREKARGEQGPLAAARWR